jgi:hypothetical protein
MRETLALEWLDVPAHEAVRPYPRKRCADRVDGRFVAGMHCQSAYFFLDALVGAASRVAQLDEK